MSELEWHHAGSVTAIDEDQPLSAEINGTKIGIFLVDGEYYAIEDVCPHAYALLSQGFIEGCEIECPLHEARFDLTNGKWLDGPGERDLQTYQVKIDDDKIIVEV